jgi:hypothetical protein
MENFTIFFSQNIEIWVLAIVYFCAGENLAFEENPFVAQTPKVTFEQVNTQNHKRKLQVRNTPKKIHKTKITFHYFQNIQ